MPVAIVEQGRVLVGNAAASQAGIEPGTGMAAARMLAPSVTLLARNRVHEAAALQTLACWAGSFTPRVHLTEDALLLEIGSCLRLFGGLDRLVAAAEAGLQAQGYSLVGAVAPTPLGAHWLAQCGTGTAALCANANDMASRLAVLPITVLPEKAAVALARFGARNLGDVRRLPGAALGRRIGAESLQLLARAFGDLPDPRADFVFPARFVEALELPATVENAAALLFAARRLTAALSGWLTARQAGVRGFALHLQHGRTADESQLLLQFAEPTAAAERFERVLRERLERMVLRAPVTALRLVVHEVVVRPQRNHELFETGATALFAPSTPSTLSGQEALGVLLERLSARLGERQVYRLEAHDDHRPERATRRTGLFGKNRPATRAAPVTSVAPVTPAAPRPLWLLARPEALAEVDGRPCHRRHGRLDLLAGPERIESGWWDGGEGGEAKDSIAENSITGDIRRDYFIALSADARWLWIYRECRAPGGWFLHGVFA